MTPSGLREELDRIASGAPTVPVPADTWARGRRSRRRSRLATGVAVLACLALVGGLVLWHPTGYHQPPPVAEAQADLRVPSHVHAVPDHVLADPGNVTTDLAVGPAAAAYGAEHGVTVVIDAATGGYHLLDLGGPVGGVLSPDGTRLATGSTDHRSVIVVDLRTGVRDQVSVLPAGSPDQLAGVFWSPTGQYLGWEALPGQAGAPGRSRVGSLRADRLTEAQAATLSGLYLGGPVAVADSGALAVASTEGLRVIGPDGDQTVPAPSGLGSPLLLHWDGDDVVDLRGAGADDEEGVVAVVHHPDGSTEQLGVAGSLDLRLVDSVSWVDGRHLLVHSARDELGVATLGDPVSYRVVGRVDRDEHGVFLGVSFATDLLADGRGTADRPEPDWPWSWQQWLTLGGVLLGAVLLALLVWRTYRRWRAPAWVYRG